MLLEKYLTAARTIVSKAVPTVPGVPAEKMIPGRSFRRESAGADDENAKGPLSLSYYEQASLSTAFRVQHAGHYQLTVDLVANEKYVDNQFDYNRCRLVFKADGSVLVHDDAGGYKPLNWMTPPSVVEESNGSIVVRKRAGKSEDRLEIAAARGHDRIDGRVRAASVHL